MEDVTYPKGFTAWGLSAGIKKNGNPDLGVLVSEPPAQAFGALTTNAVQAAPVQYCRRVLDGGSAVSHVLVNSGNANACTGARGLTDVHAEVAALREVGSPRGEVLVSSTGVIGEYLPMEKLFSGIANLFESGAAKSPFVQAIMTTDTFEKKTQASLLVGGREVRIGGVAKGAGMIRPNMATMLCYLTTDIALERGYRPTFLDAVTKSFNSISVDGDMSTNDTCVLLANGASGIAYQNLSDIDRKAYDQALRSVMVELAKAIIRDGEGATKLITIEAVGAPDDASAQDVCRAIANSPLVKTAFFGCDANWGRVLAAAGSCGVPLETEKLALEFCGIGVMAKGAALKYDEADLTARMRSRDVSVRVDLGMGLSHWTYWTCDLSYDYVKINAAYRT